MNEPTWKSTTDGKETNIRDLHDGHLANILRRLNRDVEIVRIRDEYAAQVNVEDEEVITDVVKMSDSEWLEKEHPSYRFLAAEAERRKKLSDFNWETYGSHVYVEAQFNRFGGRHHDIMPGEEFVFIGFSTKKSGPDQFFRARAFFTQPIELGSTARFNIAFMNPSLVKKGLGVNSLTIDKMTFTIFEGRGIATGKVVEVLPSFK